jgi:GTP-binding protein EngB required for normal cell division
VPSYDELRASALEQFGPVITAARRADAVETLRRLEAARDRLTDSRLTVVVCGEFSRGKSTLINALLDRDDEHELLPTGFSYTTSLAMTIAHGAEERITVLVQGGEEGGAEDASEPPVEEKVLDDPVELRDYVIHDGNPGNGQRVLGASIELPSPLLASGLMLIDTPGIGGVHTAHTAATRAVLPLADAIIFVLDVHTPATGSELRFLRRAVEAAGVAEERDALICVLTKIDQVTDYDEAVARTRAKLAEATGWPSVPVVPVSSTAKIGYLASRDELDFDDSNFRELELVLWRTLARRRARVLLGSALADLDGAVKALLDPIDAELSVLRAAGPEAARQLRDAFGARSRSLAGLELAAADWRRELADEASAMAAAVTSRALEHAGRAWENVAEYLKDEAQLDDIDQLLAQIEADLYDVPSIADRMLYERAGLLQRRLADTLGLNLGSAEVRRLPAAPPPAVRAAAEPAEPATTADPATTAGDPGQEGGKVKDLGSSSIASISSTVGSVLGRVVELLVAPGAGARISGTIGGAAGLLVGGAVKLARWRTPDGAARQQPRDEIRRQLGADLEEYYQQEFRPHVSAQVAAVTDEWAALIAAEIESRIRQEQASAAESARRADQTQEDTDRATARQAHLLAAGEPLAEARRQVAELARLTEELATYGGAGPGAERGEER